MNWRMPALARLGLVFLLTLPFVANAAEIKIFTTRAVATVLEKIGPDFERETGHKLNVTSDIAIRMVRRIQAGEPFDVLVAAPGQVDGLIKDGKIVAETRTNLVRSGIGVQVRAGATSELVAKGDIELGMVIIAQILTTPGVELVGPLPPEIQSYITFTAGVGTNSSAPGAARDLLKFLSGPAAIPVIRSQGMEPG